jgi:membrane peptidoglycan carboxypeptidase
MVMSLNTTYYAVAERVGPERVRTLANALGIPARYGSTPTMVDLKGDPAPGRTRADISLGRYPVAPADLASVYATFANGGGWTERHFVSTVDSDGKRWYTASPATRRALSGAVAADVTNVLAKVVGPVAGHPAAGKAGSQQYGNTADIQDAWMAGYTPRLACVVWLGRPKPAPIRDIAGHPIDGDGLPAALWREFMSGALGGSSTVPLPPPAHLGRTDAGDADQPPSRSGHRPLPSPSTHPAPGPRPSPSPSRSGHASPSASASIVRLGPLTADGQMRNP